MNHSESCQERYEKSKMLESEWLEKWPDACQQCGASGYFSWDEDVAGDGGSRMTMTDSCEDCLALYQCPRCRNIVVEIADIDNVTDEEEKMFNRWLRDEKPCPRCGWRHGKNKGDYIPEVWVCYGECIYG